MAEKKDNRCWPGYEPVKGKEPHSQGSCRSKGKSKLTSPEKKFRTKRRRQLDEWQDKHPGSRRSAAQHLRAPSTKKKANSKPVKSKSGASTKSGNGTRKPAKRKR